MFAKYRIPALVKAIIFTNFVLRGLTRLLARESLKDLKNAFFGDVVVFSLEPTCGLDISARDVNTRDCLRTWDIREPRLNSRDN